ncbi:hypothetical protein GQ44DRAFT_630510 [Phaeosphaeriaceae sp. PMI808]|nr:hypothetical protein GQ44DRAFT_630510 [Phaeosphaeriaceae sp. PMI808]
MNADEYLRKQGWKGSGHSLDTTGRGIKKPLLIAHKQDQLGLGKKKAAYTTDDQWWMRAYDQSLQSIGTGKDSTLNQIRTKGINRGGLYGFFVKGEAIAGTIDDSSASVTDASVPPSGASTPPTSASDTEAPAKAVKSTEEKRRRTQKNDTATNGALENPNKVKKSKRGNQDAVSRKIAKLPPAKKALSEQRAAAKKQTLHEYILRRIEKKSEQRSTR